MYNLNLSDQEEAIAAAWRQALADMGVIPGSPEHSRDGLALFTHQILALLSDDPYQPVAARAVGIRLAQLGTRHADGLAALQPILHQALTRGLEPDPARSISARLGRVFIDLTVGLVEQRSSALLLEQERALQAFDAEWKRFIADRQEMEQKSQAILRALPDAISIITLDGVVLYHHPGANPHFPKEEELPYQNIRSYMPAPVVDDLLAIYRATSETGRPRTHEYSVTFQDGEERDFQENITPYLGNSVLVISRDVTQQKQIETELRASQIRYRNVVEDQPEIIARWKPDGTITFVNTAACNFFGMQREQLIGRPYQQFIQSIDLDEFKNLSVAVSLLTPERPVAQGQTHVQMQSDEPHWLHWRTRAIFDDNHQIIEYQTVATDITEIKQAQEALEQQNTMLLQLSEQLINIQETERQRISRDLHDSVLNELGAMLISPPEMFTPKMVRDNYEQLIGQLRETINGLRSPMLNYGLHAALEDLLDNLTDNQQGIGTLRLDIPPSQARFDAQVELHLFRIIQQACENALQHARAQSIRIYGQITEAQVDITVGDDGIGFPIGQETDLAHILAKKHFGLVSMLERGELINADVQLSSKPGAGTQVRVLWKPG